MIKVKPLPTIELDAVKVGEPDNIPEFLHQRGATFRSRSRVGGKLNTITFDTREEEYIVAGVGDWIVALPENQDGFIRLIVMTDHVFHRLFSEVEE